MCKSHVSLHNLAPVHSKHCLKCVNLCGALEVAAQRFTVKFSHQRMDGCEETAGVTQAHTHAPVLRDGVHCAR